MRTLRFVLFAALIPLALTGAAAPAVAAENPQKVPLGVYSEPTALTTSGTRPFQCGTYAGNENDQRWLYFANQSRLAKAPAAPANAFVYDDVWVVEDDGTLLFTGTNSFDTQPATLRFAPNGSGGVDVSQITFAWDVVFGTNLNLSDDGNSTQNLLFSFPYFGTNWGDVHVNANGVLAFGQDVNPSGFFNNDDFFSTVPKIAGYFMDLNPQAGGAVYHKAEATKSTFTWDTVPEYGTSNNNSFQIVLHDDGTIDVTFFSIATTIQSSGSPITLGVHPGGATPVLDLVSFSDDLPYSSAAGVGVYELYYSYTNPLVNETAVFQRFYQQYPDHFFQLVYFTNFIQTMAGFANEHNISNDVTGINLGIFDDSGLYGSNGVLESRCNMNRLAAWNVDPTARVFGSENNFLTIMGQEAGHRWGAFIYFRDAFNNPSNLLLGRSDAHWSFYADVDHSSLEGGNWEFVSGDLFTTPTQIDFYGDIDEYLFGLRSAEEVTETFYVSSPWNDQPQNRAMGTPVLGDTAHGTPVTVTIDDIIAEEGARTPVFESENKDLRQAFMLIHRNGTTPTQAELDKIAGFRRAWEDYFELSCDGRITVNTTLDTDLPVAVLEGHVIDELTMVPVPDLTATLVERGFIQFVGAGGRYHFRCMPDSLPAPDSCCVTVMLEAPGYTSKIVEFCLPWGETTGGDIRLRPVPTGTGDLPLARAELRQNYPNPFNPETTLEYAIPNTSPVRLELFDVYGRHIRTLVDAPQGPGVHRAVWDGRDDGGALVGSGVYFARLQTPDGILKRKIIMLK